MLGHYQCYATTAMPGHPFSTVSAADSLLWAGSMQDVLLGAAGHRPVLLRCCLCGSAAAWWMARSCRSCLATCPLDGIASALLPKAALVSSRQGGFLPEGTARQPWVATPVTRFIHWLEAGGVLPLLPPHRCCIGCTIPGPTDPRSFPGASCLHVRDVPGSPSLGLLLVAVGQFRSLGWL
jgi:hypothetical protein